MTVKAHCDVKLKDGKEHTKNALGTPAICKIYIKLIVLPTVICSYCGSCLFFSFLFPFFFSLSVSLPVFPSLSVSLSHSHTHTHTHTHFTLTVMLLFTLSNAVTANSHSNNQTSENQTTLSSTVRHFTNNLPTHFLLRYQVSQRSCKHNSLVDVTLNLTFIRNIKCIHTHKTKRTKQINIFLKEGKQQQKSILNIKQSSNCCKNLNEVG